MTESEKCLCLYTMHSGSESQSQYNNIYGNFDSLWRHFLISVVSLSHTSFRTHSTEGKIPPQQRIDCSRRLNLKKRQPMRKGYGKSISLPLRITQSGGGARPRESSPLSEVGKSLVWVQANTM